METLYELFCVGLIEDKGGLEDARLVAATEGVVGAKVLSEADRWGSLGFLI